MIERGRRRIARRCCAWACAVVVSGLAPAFARAQHPSFEGVWSGVFTTQDNDYWLLEDLVTCFPGCTPGAYEQMAGLLDDSTNDERPLDALRGENTAFMRQELAAKLTPEGLALQNKNTPANDPTILCAPYGLVREAINPLPIHIHQEGGNLVIDYEEWTQTRTIYMDGRGHPADLESTPLGHSIGRYEGGALVVETVGISPDIYYSFQSGGGYSDQASVVERYTIAQNPKRLLLEMAVTDPVTLREPQVFIKTWLWTPEVELVEDSCEDVPGKP
jgi:hypothetical protein